jgi:pectate lyase
VRKYGSKWRVDVPGLKAGDYTLKIAGVKGGKEGSSATTKTLSVKAHDRSGFAFSNGRVPGAYKKDGTLKDGAVVIYVSESTKNTVSLDVVTSGKGATTACKGLQAILTGFKKGYDTRPLDIRIIGNVTDPDSTDKGDILVDLGKKEEPSLTIEGIGADATANGWGIRIKNAQNVEVRNLGFMNVDSGEGDNVGLQQDNQYVWVHNCDFFYGAAGSDADQVKGDGALDCKKSTYVTFSYNHFWDNGKSNLLGLSEGSTDGLYITYHHNWYDHSDSRHPRVRYYSAHVYNNYYDGIAKYGAGSTLGSSVFMESNYFRNCKYPMLTSMQGSDVYAGSENRDEKNNPTFSKEDGGTIKAYNNYMEGSYTFIPYGASEYVLKGAEAAVGSIDTKADFDAYVVDSRDAKVPTSVKSYAGANTYNNFDTDASVMYGYTADAPDVARDNVVRYAGRVQGGDFRWEFDNSEDDAAYAVNQPLKDALVAYRGWDGSVIPGTDPESSSSSAEPESSSSSADTESSSSTTVIPGGASPEQRRRNPESSILPAVRYVASEARLEIVAEGPFRVDILRVDGTKMFTSRSREIDLSVLRPGVYLARLIRKGRIDVKTFLR